MARYEELAVEDGRVASLTRDQTWTTHADKRHIAGDLLVVSDNSTGSRVEAVVYEQDGKRKFGILRRVIVWEGTGNPAVDATSSDAVEIPDALPNQAEELARVYGRFKR
jgi:hypothetical protein